jgi:CRP-like cAMP-binding protein
MFGCLRAGWFAGVEGFEMSHRNVPPPRLKTLFAKVRHFDKLQPEVQEQLEAAAALRRFNAGQVVYLEGEPAESIFIVESGWVKATRMSHDGREQALLFLRTGEMFGDVAVFSHASYPGTVTALEDASLWVIPAATILQLTEQHPDMAMAVIRHLGDRVLYYVDMIDDLSLCSVEARLARTLLKHARVSEGRLMVPRETWTTFDEMAVRLGTVRDVLSRSLKTLEAEGLLEVKRREIILLDPKGLAARGES